MRVFIFALLMLIVGCSTMQPGLEAMNRGDLDAAERNFSEALRRGDTMAWNNLGVVYQRRGQRDKAIAHYTMAARWGHHLAQQNLAALGAPIPPADLAAQRAQTNYTNTANTLMLMQAMQPAAPPPAPFPRHTNCTSQRVGDTVQTRCN